MTNLICFAHRYKGKGAPNIACKLCCSIFIQTVKPKEEKQAK